MLKTISFRKVTYIYTNLLHYLSFNGDVMKFTWYLLIFFLLLTLIAFLNNIFLIVFDIGAEKSVWNLLYHWTSLQCETIALAFGSCLNPLWTSLTFVCCCSVEEITSLVMLYINYPWSWEKGLQAFRKLIFLTFPSIISNGETFLRKYVSTVPKLRRCTILQNHKILQFIWALSNSAPTPTHSHPLPLIPIHPHLPKIIWYANVPNGVPIFHFGVPNFYTFLLRNAKGNFYTLLLYKKF